MLTKDNVDRHILVVDDEPDVLSSLKSFLEILNYRVTDVTNSKDALAVIERESIDLVITDVEMPGMSGIELLNAVRKNRPDIPVIIQTGKPRLEAAIECMKVGARDYLCKPFDPAALKGIIENLLADENSADESHIDTIKLDNQGRILGGYRVLRLLGEGTFGIVFLAEKIDHVKIHQYALKLLKTSILDKDTARDYIERFIHEAEAASQIDHPGIVKIIEYGIADEEAVPFMVMEYIHGKSLRDYIDQDKTLDYRQKAKILLQIAEALAAIHAHGIFHRDIKPTNVIIDNKRNVKLIDFGIAKIPESMLTATMSILGTPGYLSPEAFSSAHVDHRGDIFALGIIAYEFLLGKVPFSADNLQSLAYKIQEEMPKAPHVQVSDFPPELQNIVAGMLKKDPDSRYQSAQEVIADLNMFLATGHETPREFVKRFNEEDWS